MIVKKHKSVVEAEKALADKDAEIAAAKIALSQFEKERAECYSAVRAAQTEADASLPQCRMVRVTRGGAMESSGDVVILRRTPAGKLVVRRAGEATYEYMFKWSEFSGRYREHKSGHSSFSIYSLELRDVPAEFLPVTITEGSPCKPS